MRNIDDRQILSASATPMLDQGHDAWDLSGPQAAIADMVMAPEAAAGGKHGGGDGGGDSDGGGDGGSSAAVHTTLAVPGIGLGYASLDAIEDKETGFVMTDAGLTTFTSGAHGYYVNSSVQMDAALSKILGFDAASGDFSDISHAIGGLTPTAFGAHPILSDQDRAYDVTGTNSADTILGADQSDMIHGGSGGDSLGGGEGDDVIWGGVGNDVISGDNGADQLWGNAGIDNITGGLGDDFLFGGSGNDKLQGSEGSDLLLGGTGNDALDGGDGDDALVGGGGADTLTGSAGHDTFIFAQGDSGAGAANQDTVADFTIGEDTLDLTSFTKALHVVSAFDHHAYEMVVTDSDTGSLIQIDLNGDGVADQEIAVTTSDHGHLSGSDYVI
jgi:Ca2+-binding RTX toxin-like protein